MEETEVEASQGLQDTPTDSMASKTASEPQLKLRSPE